MKKGELISIAGLREAREFDKQSTLLSEKEPSGKLFPRKPIDPDIAAEHFFNPQLTPIVPERRSRGRRSENVVDLHRK